MLHVIILEFINQLWASSGSIPLEITLPPQLARQLAQEIGLPWTALPTESVAFELGTPYGPLQITSASYV